MRLIKLKAMRKNLLDIIIKETSKYLKADYLLKEDEPYNTGGYNES
ncbi:MAG: hypothetical protein HYS32_04260 [Candidatus Woesearchaeota archaeon]|nr:MAG: hypothetical protein HYS32_04260 [Candidatus Woesearchaeota archaeon]